MSMDLNAYAQALADSLEAFATNYIVSRELLMPQEFDSSFNGELYAGRFSVLSAGLGNTRNIPGAAVHGGDWNIAILGQIKLPEKASGADVEAAESAMFKQLCDWLNSPIDDEINCLEIKAMRQSQQLEKPYGWISVLIEVSL